MRDAAQSFNSLQGRAERELRVHHTTGAHVQYVVLLPVCIQHDFRRKQIRYGQGTVDVIQLSHRVLHFLHVRQYGRGGPHRSVARRVQFRMVRKTQTVQGAADDDYVPVASSVAADRWQSDHS